MSFEAEAARGVPTTATRQVIYSEGVPYADVPIVILNRIREDSSGLWSVQPGTGGNVKHMRQLSLIVRTRHLCDLRYAPFARILSFRGPVSQ